MIYTINHWYSLEGNLFQFRSVCFQIAMAEKQAETLGDDGFAGLESLVQGVRLGND